MCCRRGVVHQLTRKLCQCWKSPVKALSLSHPLKRPCWRQAALPHASFFTAQWPRDELTTDKPKTARTNRSTFFFWFLVIFFFFFFLLAGWLGSSAAVIHSLPIVLCFCLIQLDNARLESIHRLSSCLIDSILHIYDAWTAITDSGFTASPAAGYTNDEKSSQFRATVLSPYMSVLI